MAITTTSDLNVELTELTSAPAPVELNVADNSIEAAAFRRAIHELESVRAGLEEPMRSELGNLISSLQSQFSISGTITSNIASALQEARGQATQYTAIAAQNNQAALYEALDLNASERSYVSRRVSAMMSNDVVELLAIRMEDPQLKALMPDDLAAIKVDTQEYLKSAEYKAVREEIIKEGEPALAKRETRLLRRQQALDELLEKNPSGPVHDLLVQAQQNNLLKHWESKEFLRAVRNNESPEQIRAAYDELMQVENKIAAGELKDPQRDFLQRSERKFIRSLSEEKRGHIDTSEEVVAEARLQTTAEKRDAYHVWKSRNPGADIEKAPKDIQATSAALALLAGIETGARDKALLAELVNMRTNMVAIEKSRTEGTELQGDLKEYASNLSFINKTENPLQERAELLAKTVGGRLKDSVHTSDSASLGLAVVTLGFVDRNGGLEKHFEMLTRAEKNPEDKTAKAYKKAYSDYMQVTLLGEDVDGRARSDVLTAQTLLGDRLKNNSLSVASGSSGIVFYDRNDTGYEGRSTLLSARNALSSELTGTQEMVKIMYKESRAEPKPDAEFVKMIEQIDTYRIHNDPSSKPLIEALWRGTPAAELRPKLDAIMAEENSGMKIYSQAALAQTDQFQRDLLKKYDLLEQDGSINVPALMDRVRANKIDVYDIWEANKAKPMSAIPENLQEARALSEVATALRAAHSIEHLIERGTSIENALGTTNSNAILAEDQKMHMAIMQYDPVTKAGKKEFDAAISKYLMQDEYIRKKEEADVKITAEGRTDTADIVKNTIALLEDRLAKNPELFREDANGHDHENEQLSGIGAALASATGFNAAMEAAQLVHQATKAEAEKKMLADVREKEGSAGAFDDLHKTDLEKAIIGAVSGISLDRKSVV